MHRWFLLAATLAVSGCNVGDAVPSPADSVTPPLAADVSIEAVAPSWPLLGPDQPCAIRWLSPDAGPRNGTSVIALVEIPVAAGTELVTLDGWSEGPEDANHGASVTDLPLPGRFEVAFDVPVDGDWRLCLRCLQSDGLHGQECEDGWSIDNVAPPAPTNFRRID